MAISSQSSSSKTADKQVLPRRLSDLLEEKQEPFVLEIYLLERGCKRTSLGLDGSNDRKTKKTGARKGSAQFSSIARSLYNKMVLINGVLRPKNDRKQTKKRRNGKEAADLPGGRCSTVSCSTISNAWSETDIDADSISSSANNAAAHESVADEVMMQWRFVEENKQYSPDSVLDEIDLLQSIPVYNVRHDQKAPTTSSVRFQKKVSDESILSASLWEMLLLSRKENPKKSGSNSFPQYMNSKKALQQTRQLLFDCVREVVENNNNAKQQRTRTEKGLMAPEEIGKILCNSLKAWGKQSAGEKGVRKLLATDLVSSFEGWGGSEACRREIAIEIGNSIFEEITEDVVRDMVYQNKSTLFGCSVKISVDQTQLQVSD